MMTLREGRLSRLWRDSEYHVDIIYYNASSQLFTLNTPYEIIAHSYKRNQYRKNMEPDINNDNKEPSISSETLTETKETSTDQNQLTEQSSQPVVQTEKKSKKKLVVLIAIILGLILVSILGYLAYGYFNPSTKTTNNSTTSKKETDINPSVEAAASTLTGSAISESSVTSTDDSDIANEANSLTNSTGDIVDEDNL